MDIEDDLADRKRNYTAESIGKSFIKSVQLFDKIEGPVPEKSNVVHHLLVMITPKTKTVYAEDSQLFIL